MAWLTPLLLAALIVALGAAVKALLSLIDQLASGATTRAMESWYDTDAPRPAREAEPT